MAISVAERLLPHVSIEKIENMGITNAAALARKVKQTGLAPTPEIVEAGITMELHEYRAALEESFHVYEEHPKGRWRELGGFYAEDEEWATIQQAFKLVEPEENFSKETPDWYRLKIRLLDMSQEIIGTYGEAPNENPGQDSRGPSGPVVPANGTGGTDSVSPEL
jgi:hypothetical protein